MQKNITSVIKAFGKCGEKIYKLISTDSQGYASTKNSSGDSQLKIDIASDEIIENELVDLECIKGICSEEKNEIKWNNKNSNLMVAYDPLDGSSLMDSNLSVGTIFGIYDDSFEAKNIVASGYILYGPRMEMVVATDVVKHYLFTNGEWLEKGQLLLGQKGKINASGGTQQYWSSKHKGLIDGLFSEGYRLRYSGGMVPDLHQILIKGGGLFSYPATKDAPSGKLRKLFEVFPFAFIYQKAGGEAIDGVSNLLDLDINGIHESTQCFFGSTYEIEKVREVYGRK